MDWDERKRREAKQKAWQYVLEREEAERVLIAQQERADSAKFIGDMNRLEEAHGRTYQPIRPRLGYKFVPPGVYRLLDQLEDAIKADDEKRVRGVQRRIAHSGHEVPTTLHEIADIRKRLKESVNIT
jgi:hypothetical protein